MELTVSRKSITMGEDKNRGFPEDRPEENGQYMSTCISCGHTFLGHKRRVTCRVCGEAEAYKTEGSEFCTRCKLAKLFLSVCEGSNPGYIVCPHRKGHGEFPVEEAFAEMSSACEHFVDLGDNNTGDKQIATELVSEYEAVRNRLD